MIICITKFLNSLFTINNCNSPYVSIGPAFLTSKDLVYSDTNLPDFKTYTISALVTCFFKLFGNRLNLAEQARRDAFPHRSMGMHKLINYGWFPLIPRIAARPS